MKKLLWMSSVAAAAFAASSAQATVTVCDTPACAPFDENVLIDVNNTPSPTVTGHTNTTNAPILFTSDEAQGLIGPSNGQARVEAADGVLNSLKFELLDGYTFGSALWNLNNALSDTSVTVTYYDPIANVWGQVFALVPQGQNFMGIFGTTERFTAISFAFTGGVSDLRQLRFGDVAKVTTPSVPEPATWAMLIGGFALAGLQMRRRKTAVSFA